MDERLGLGKLIDEHLSDSRQGLNKKFPLADLLRQSVYSRLAGYEDVNDAVRVSADPTFRLIGSKKNWNRGGALPSRLQSFEAGLLAGDENLIGLMAVNRELVAQAETSNDSERVVLDMDSTESPVHGQQELPDLLQAQRLAVLHVDGQSPACPLPDPLGSSCVRNNLLLQAHLA